mmetsp:Transcript_30589/g.67019  ORF Transcript_30589/g.67019 Transcript_30589/m.67019 type:complete len:216 (-) Transcript_30589:91-738(-)
MRRSSMHVEGRRFTGRARSTVNSIACFRCEHPSMSTLASSAPFAISPLTLRMRSPTRSPACSARLIFSMAQTRAPAFGSEPMVTPSGPLAGSHLTTTVDAPSSASDASFRKAESSALARCEGPAAARHTAELMYVPTTEAEISYVHRTTECEQRARRVSRSTPKLCSLLFACKSTFDNKTRLISQSLRQQKRLILCTMSPGPAKWGLRLRESVTV